MGEKKWIDEGWKRMSETRFDALNRIDLPAPNSFSIESIAPPP